jgi:hypothetical protein
MSARPKPTQSEFLDEDLSLLNPSVEAPAIRLADLKNDPSWRPSLGNLDPLGRLGRLEPLAFAPYLITFSIGIAVALVWQSYGQRDQRGRLAQSNLARSRCAAAEPRPDRDQCCHQSRADDAQNRA